MILALLSHAFGAEDFDAHGFHLVGFTDDPTAALQLPMPASFSKGGFYAGVLGEYADSPLVRVNTDGTVERLLDDVVAFNLSAGWAPFSRLRFDVALPMYATSAGLDGGNGLSFGDVRVGANAVVVDGPVGLSVVPIVDLPSGDDQSFLGHSGLAASLLVSSRAKLGHAYVALAAGPSFIPDIELGNLAGADRLLMGAQAGYSFSESTALSTELRAEVPFASNSVPGTDTPVELMLYGHHRFKSGAHLLLGGATALTSGASAAAYRIFLGGGFGQTAKRAPVDTDGDGFFDPDDTCPTEAETVNALKDTDGCADQLGALVIDVTMDGKPVTGAAIEVVGTRPTTAISIDTALRHVELMPGDVYTATATTGCMVGSGQATVPEGDGPLHIELKPDLAARVRMEVYDATDKPLDGAVITWARELGGCVPDQPTTLKDAHVGAVSLGVGQHTVFVSVEGYKIFEQALELVRGDDKLLVIKLAPTRVKVTANRIDILDKVYFEFDGDQIDPRSTSLLDEVATTLKQHPEILLVEVGGHTDSKGADVYNADLSQRRVNSVRTYLIGRGVDEAHLVAKGYGETKPIADNKTAAGRANNRRVEFAILRREESALIEVKTIDEATLQDKDKAGMKDENRPAESQIDKKD